MSKNKGAQYTRKEWLAIRDALKRMPTVHVLHQSTGAGFIPRGRDRTAANKGVTARRG